MPFLHLKQNDAKQFQNKSKTMFCFRRSYMWNKTLKQFQNVLGLFQSCFRVLLGLFWVCFGFVLELFCFSCKSRLRAEWQLLRARARSWFNSLAQIHRFMAERNHISCILLIIPLQVRHMFIHASTHQKHQRRSALPRRQRFKISA